MRAGIFGSVVYSFENTITFYCCFVDEPERRTGSGAARVTQHTSGVAGRAEVRHPAVWLYPVEKLPVAERVVHVVPQRGRLVAMPEQPRDRFDPLCACQ